MRFGPDVEWIDAPDYEVDPGRGALFYAAIRRYWPALPDGALVPDYAGIRPKLSGPGRGRPTSSSTARPSTGCRGSCISSASRARG